MPSKRTRKTKSKKPPRLNVTSMMDMFTIILVFLLKSFSSDGQLITPAEGLEVPVSSTQLSAKPALEIIISKKEITMGGRQVALVKDIVNSKTMNIDGLINALKKEKESGTQLAHSQGREFEGKLLIQGDKSIPYVLLTKVMYSCGQAGYSKQNFAVYKNE